MDDLLRTIGQSGPAAAQRANRAGSMSDPDGSEFGRFFNAAEAASSGDGAQDSAGSDAMAAHGDASDPETPDTSVANGSDLDMATPETDVDATSFDIGVGSTGVPDAIAIADTSPQHSRSISEQGDRPIVTDAPAISSPTQQRSAAGIADEKPRANDLAISISGKASVRVAQQPGRPTTESIALPDAGTEEPLQSAPVIDTSGSGNTSDGDKVAVDAGKLPAAQVVAVERQQSATPPTIGTSEQSQVPRPGDAPVPTGTVTPVTEADGDPLQVRITHAAPSGQPEQTPMMTSTTARQIEGGVQGQTMIPTAQVTLGPQPISPSSVLEADMATLIKDFEGGSRDTVALRVEAAPFRTGGWMMGPPTYPALQTTPLFSAISATTGVEPGIIPNMIADMGMETLAMTQMSTASVAPVASGQTMPATIASPMASVIAHQIAAALTDSSRERGAPLELALDPPELGRVRMQVAEIAGVMTLTIHADRPDTADLMRRHLDLLSQEFAEAGLDAPSVRISQDGSGQNASPGGHPDTPGHMNAETDIAPDTSAIVTLSANGGLDLRL
ncbi:flagellar hook-length control protein FliK [Gymnodinialimonas sp. 2305UL16-5]|uniref:flagellar hook-length control protein FliK n=1 Tax=Gymnodinialimonas mytili TaxID=3126503 RepID=UPI0030A845FF